MAERIDGVSLHRRKERSGGRRRARIVSDTRDEQGLILTT